MRCVVVFSVQPTSPRPRPIFFIKTKRPRVTRYLPHIGSQKSPSLGSFFSPPVFSACTLIAVHNMATKSSLLDRISEVGATLSHPHRHLTPMVAGPRSPQYLLQFKRSMVTQGIRQPDLDDATFFASALLFYPHDPLRYPLQPLLL